MKHGDFYLDKQNLEATILIHGRGNTAEQPEDKNIALSVYRCFYENCITPTPPVPPSERPNVTRIWSKLEDWNGKYNFGFPKKKNKLQNIK